MSFNYFPKRFGASNDSDTEAILNDLLSGLGSAFDTEYGSITWIKMNAVARVLNDVFEQNKRLSYQWDPLRMSDFLPRWETIYGLNPLPTDTEVERREKVLAAVQTSGLMPTQQVVTDLLTSLLGPVFVGITNLTPLGPSPTALTYVSGGAVIPGGITIPDGAAIPPAPPVIPWLSTISYVAIQVEQPSYMDNDTFYQTANQIYTFLDNLLPAWVAFGWFVNDPSTPVTGPGGFILDTPNLDREAFSS